MGVTLRFMYDGKFYLGPTAQVMYRRIKEHIKEDVDLDLISKIELESILAEEVGINSVRQLWFAECGKTIDDGLREICGDPDILKIIETVGYGDTCYVYVVQNGELSPSDLRNPNVSKVNPTSSSPRPIVDSESNAPTRIASKLPVRKPRLPELLVQSEEDDEEDDENQNEEDIAGSESSDADSDFQFVPSDAEDDDIWA